MAEAITPVKAWILAARPRTLPAAAAPVLAAAALAWHESSFRPGPALAALVGALLLQIGANFANDLMDHQRGTDHDGRLGPLRMTSAGLISPERMRLGAFIVFGLAAVCGLYLTWQAGWVVIMIGVASILAALAYTGGPYPLGYNGLGEVFVFLFFGLAAVMGAYYVQTLRFSWSAFLLSVPLGLLITAILVVNNLRDLDGDRLAGKLTQAARHGARWTRREYLFCWAGAFLAIPVGIVLDLLPWPCLAVALGLPMALRLQRSVDQDIGKALNKTLAGTGKLTLVFALLVSLGLVIARLAG